ncbi:MAG: Rid family detoxifying hydrolase [Pseudomonadota bacterium]|nr:Rid family detoxifying hydrolase [Pseudomonadota bacterium]
MARDIIATNKAPQAIGPYSQAVRAAGLIFVSGQIPLEPTSMALISADFRAQAHQVFRNLHAIAESAGANFDDCVKLMVYLTDLDNFEALNEVMADYLASPFPARAVAEVAGLPRNALLEIDAILTDSSTGT